MMLVRRLSTAAAIAAWGCLSPAAAASLLRRHLGRLEAWGQDAVIEDMRPDLVADLFRDVEHSWVQSRRQADIQEAGSEAEKNMVRSCSKVALSVVRGSAGDERRVLEYMRLVCHHLQSDSEASAMCSQFGAGIVGVMRGDAEFNRNELDLSSFCSEFYRGAVREEASRELASMENSSGTLASARPLAEKNQTYTENIAPSGDASGTTESVSKSGRVNHTIVEAVNSTASTEDADDVGRTIHMTVDSANSTTAMSGADATTATEEASEGNRTDAPEAATESVAEPATNASAQSAPAAAPAMPIGPEILPPEALEKHVAGIARQYARAEEEDAARAEAWGAGF